MQHDDGSCLARPTFLQHGKHVIAPILEWSGYAVAAIALIEVGRLTWCTRRRSGFVPDLRGTGRSALHRRRRAGSRTARQRPHERADLTPRYFQYFYPGRAALFDVQD